MTDRTRETNEAQGTVRYMSPELLNGKITFKADIWAIGCILLQFITGRQPFDGIANDVTVTMKAFSGLTPLDHARNNYSTSFDQNLNTSDLLDFLKLALECDYDTRPTANELLRHSFLSAS